MKGGGGVHLGFHRRERKASCELLKRAGDLALRCMSKLVVGIEVVRGIGSVSIYDRQFNRGRE